MIGELGTEGYQPVSTFAEQSLFKLQCLLKATEIQDSALCEYGEKLLLAFTTGNAEIIFYYKRDAGSFPVIKRLPWFQGAHKQISALCFHPLGSWLLCASIDGSLHVIPALFLVEETREVDKRWNMTDITSFPTISSQSSHSRPTAIVWWQEIATPTDVAIIGTEYGEVVFINLESGHQISATHVNGNIDSLHVCRDQSTDSVSLLITSQAKQQWRLLLEQHAYSCLQHTEIGESYNVLHSNEDIYDSAKTFASTRSRLQGLKQLSVEKLAILRQKLIETKNLTLGENLRSHDVIGNRNANNVNASSELCSEVVQNHMTPEPISKDTFLLSQHDRDGQQLYTCYHAVTSHITVHGPDFSTVPLSVHKVFESCRNVLLAQPFFFITDVSQRLMYVISDRLSETRTNDNCKFNPECIIAHFSLVSSKEVIRAVYRATDFINNAPTKLSQDVESKYVLPKGIKDLKIELPHMDTCIIITNRSVYKIVLRKSIVSVFMELVLRKNDLEKAMQLAMIFGLNAQRIMEQAGDILLSNKEFSRAVACYKLSKCRILRSVLKFASTGYTADLLGYLTHCLVSPAISELPVAARIHLSNLCVLAFIEMTLRVSPQFHQKSKAIYKDFLYFLSTNTFYDELLAINISGQTCLWEVLHHLATQRGLYGQMLDILMKTIHSYGANSFHPTPYGLLICISEPDLMQAMVVNPDLGRSHMSFLLSSLHDSQIFVLQRLVTLYDPTSPVLRPRIVKHKMRCRTTSYSSQSSQCDSIDFTENSDEADTLMEEIVETFLLILLTLIYKKSVLRQEPSPPTSNIELLSMKMNHITNNCNVDFKRRQLSAGYSHVALIRNGNVYTWGTSVQGCLGTGSSVLRYGSPQAISLFRTMQLEVLSVSCGHCHTLAVTNNGVYAWGSSRFGQLGLGRMIQCSSPELVTSLAQEIVVDAVAGQYHSVALTADGRVFTWGWGVHGQLGHGNTNEKSTPTLVTSLLGVMIRSISAGHAHTLALSVDGIVYAFGCNIFGQLGIGTNIKSSVPMKVLAPEKISCIATGYFHNLAVSTANKLYVWGASPQALRLQAHAQKKSRILEQQDAIERQVENIEDLEKITDETIANDVNDETFENDAQMKTAQQPRTNTSSLEVRLRKAYSTSLRNINVGLLEEAQTHLKPALIDTGLVRGEIVQISAGCHHSSLLTKDGSLYTWGRNTDRQIDKSNRRELAVPTPLAYNPIFAQVPPRHSASHKKGESGGLDMENSRNGSSDVVSEKNGNVSNGTKSAQTENSEYKERMNPAIKCVAVSCGFDYTIAIQPGGTVLAWGNNSRAQLGRIPAKDTRNTDEKLGLFNLKRFPLHTSHVALDVPSQVPSIPAPIISYQSYDVSSLAGLIRPLSVIEKTPGELTLHYALEYFSGLYDFSRIMEKGIQLGNYQVCSKIAFLQHNLAEAFSYQLKVLHGLCLGSSLKFTSSEDLQDNTGNEQFKQEASSLMQNFKKNTELFNRQVERNLIDTVEDCAARNKMKIPASRSLNSLQAVQQELYTFDYQGGSEELCKDTKAPNTPFDISEDAFDSDVSSDAEEWIENLIHENERPSKHDNIRRHTTGKSCIVSTPMKDKSDANVDRLSKNYAASKEKRMLHIRKSNIMNETIKVTKFFLTEMENESDTVKCKILEDAINFWIEHNLPMQNLENVFLEYIDGIFYPLGLLLFCQEIMEKYLDKNRNDAESKRLNLTSYFSAKFSLQVCSMLVEHINQEQPTPEYITLLSSLTADHYGPPLTGYPGSSGNNTSTRMMEGVISAVSSDSDSRSFVHIKESNAVYRFLTTEEDTMVFTCGHHFPLTAYKTEIIPTMETELLTSESLVLPCTAHFLGKLLSQTEPEILCPLCIPQALGSLVKKNNG